MALTYETIIFRNEPAIRVTGYAGGAASLQIPEMLGSLPVREIGAHAFEGHRELKTVTLPHTVKVLRPFAFYSCENLTVFSLHDTCNDYYDGVIRNCPSLREIRITCRGENDAGANYIIMREILRDVDSTLRFRLLYPDHEVRLTFPDFVSVTQEDTFARAFHFSVEGAGMPYRECISRTAIDFAGYDRLLPRLSEYDFSTGMHIALDRLMTPVRLSDRAREAYEHFLRQRSGSALELLISENDAESIRFLTRREILPAQIPDAAIRLAAEQNRTEICALLMEYQRQQAEHGRMAFSSDNIPANVSARANHPDAGSSPDAADTGNAGAVSSGTVFSLENW